MMSQIKFLKSGLILLIAFSALSFSCSDDDSSEPDNTITLRVNGTVVFDDGDDFNGDVDGDFTGNGGSGSRTFNWRNNLNRADFNADITATAGGVFNMVVRDSEDNIVLDRSLFGASEPDSIDGITSSGTPGIWTVTITLTSFNGDGSFSLSEGD